MSDRNEDVSKNVLLLTALHRTRKHDAPIRRRSHFYFKKFSIPGRGRDPVVGRGEKMARK